MIGNKNENLSRYGTHTQRTKKVKYFSLHAKSDLHILKTSGSVSTKRDLLAKRSYSLFK